MTVYVMEATELADSLFASGVPTVSQDDRWVGMLHDG